jgi:prolyl oligopeptidase PreP (S9A serine peptidase family)
MAGFADIVRSYSSMRLSRLYTANTKCAMRRQDISIAGRIVYENALSALNFSRVRKSSTGRTTATQQIARLSLLSNRNTAPQNSTMLQGTAVVERKGLAYPLAGLHDRCTTCQDNPNTEEQKGIQLPSKGNSSH